MLFRCDAPGNESMKIKPAESNTPSVHLISPLDYGTWYP